MGELALKKIQAAIEATRGTLVTPPTRNIYGTMTITREQAKRYANEDRGVFAKNFRANPKLIEAGFKLEADVTFEDFPYYCEMFMQGGVSPVGPTNTSVYTWTYAPDMTSDLIKTRTLYTGDDTVQWRGPFGVADAVDISIDLNEAVRMEMNGFVQDWVPSNSGFLTTGYTTGFSALSDRAVESVMGYQAKLYIDAAGGTMGATQVAGKLIAARLGYHLNNKRKYFGDNLNYALQKLGRGERDISAQITFEGLNQAEFADHFNNVQKLVRIQLTGTNIAASAPPTPKQINFDFWGFWDNFVIGSRETNTTFQLNLMGVYDSTAGFDHRISVVNQNNLAAGIS